MIPNETKQGSIFTFISLLHLPLAIEQVATYIRVAQNIQEYLVVYEQNRKQLLTWRPEGNYPYHYTVGTMWRTSLIKSTSTCPDSILLIRLLVFLNPDEILVEFLRAGSSGLLAKLQSIVSDK